MFIVRRTNHIEADIKRNWSSWNYGQDGIYATEDEIEAVKARCMEDDSLPFMISGFELFGEEVAKADIRELFDGYWVLVDTSRGEGLSCNVLDAVTTEEAIRIVNVAGFSVKMEEGQTVDCSEAKIVWFDGEDTYLLEV